MGRESGLPELLHPKLNASISVVFDPGSHQGNVALILEQLFCKNGKFVTVEAGLHNHSVLCENLK
jgi:hypothetical protein